VAALSLRAEDLDLHLRDPFTISRGTEEVAHNVLVSLARDGGPAAPIGRGEAAPSAHYGERRSTVRAFLQDMVAAGGADMFAGAPEGLHAPAFETLHRRLDGFTQLNPAAKAAVDMAVYDLLGKQHGLPVWAMLGADPAAAPQTSFTIGIDTPQRMAQKTRAAAAYPVLKVKVGTPRDAENLAAIREVAPQARIRVDANGAWTAKQAIAAIRELEHFGLEFVEQPCAGPDLDGLRLVREHVHLPILADESCVVAADVPRVASCVDGINIKLMKCGGIYPALQLIFAARAHGLLTMLGCMIESSLAITAAAHLSPLVDFADLDGHLLVSDDPFSGVAVQDGRLVLPQGPGLGVRRVAGDEP
jgi:L-alanine-DL-glutamate epimerase-like enolase superfamily enzyme